MYIIYFYIYMYIIYIYIYVCIYIYIHKSLFQAISIYTTRTLFNRLGEIALAGVRESECVILPEKRDVPDETVSSTRLFPVTRQLSSESLVPACQSKR
jgi:hypothetical protein